MRGVLLGGGRCYRGGATGRVLQGGCYIGGVRERGVNGEVVLEGRWGREGG